MVYMFSTTGIDHGFEPMSMKLVFVASPLSVQVIVSVKRLTENEMKAEQILMSKHFCSEFSE
jgi:hypothetical protein